MLTQSFLNGLSSDSKSHLDSINQASFQDCSSPMLISFCSQVSFKIYQSQEAPSSTYADILSKNGLSLHVSPVYRFIFIREFLSICRAKLAEMKLEKSITQNTALNQNQIQNTVPQQETLFFQFQILVENNQSKIKFSQLNQTVKLLNISEIDAFKIFIILLKKIKDPLILLFQRMGTLKPSFAQRFGKNVKIEKQKKVIKKLLRERKDFQTEASSFEMQCEQISNKAGVFQILSVMKEMPINGGQNVLKRGGYFDISKKKLVVINEENLQNGIQLKVIAQKKLNKRKRPNTIYNYEAKIPKELTLLKCLNNLSQSELDKFAKYYFLNQSAKIQFNNEEMVEESDTISKDTLSTTSQVYSTAATSSDVIYMNYYDENLEEYLYRKGKLDIFQTLKLLRQILQGVLTLHKVGIVHRDIKPANVMVEPAENGQIKTKLIDFGQSTHVSAIYSESQILGFSTPYAPIQCTYPCKQGFNSTKIDLWSLGVVIFQLTKYRMPVTYSKCFKSDIKVGWPTDLNFFLTQFSRGKWSLLQNILILTSILFMKVKPEERLNIRLGLKILDRIQKLVKQFSQQKTF